MFSLTSIAAACGPPAVQPPTASSPAVATATPAAAGTPPASPSATARPPTATVAPSPSPSGSPGVITVARPAAGDEVRSPARVQGTASVFEAAIQANVRNARGEVVGTVNGTASAGAPERGTYDLSIPFKVEGRQNGAVEVFSRSPRDGSIINLVSVPVVLVGQ